MKKTKLLFVLTILGCTLIPFLKPLEQEFAHIPNLPRNTNINKDNVIQNVIFFIGDGMGPSHVDAARIYKDDNLCFENFNYKGYVNTDSLSSIGYTLDETKSLIRPEENKSLYDGNPSPYGDSANLGTSGVVTCYTDSAAGGTAFSTGFKVNNSTIGISSDGSHLENIVEIAKALGKKAGVVSSDTITGATPASFVAHVPQRHLGEDIIRSTSESPVDLLLTQNDSAFTNNQAEFESLFKNKGFDIAYNRNTLNSGSNRLLGLFPGVTWKNDPRTLSLAELTSFSLDFLDNKEGFFLMVEGGYIDKHSHSHQSKLVINEMIGFDNAVNEAYRWAQERNDTIIVVSADHETGGLHFSRDTSNKDNIIDNMKWLSYNHSRTRVPLYIYGDISNFVSTYGGNFSTLEGLPYWDNTDIFRFMSMYL